MPVQSLTPTSDTRVEVAPAKLNLGLVVLSRRQDGFHDLLSIFQTVSLADEVRLTPAAQLSLACSDPSLPAGADNLAWRAADLYLRQAGGRPCHLEVRKAIPAGAGLGGGSADAAAVLRGLDALACRPVGLPALAELGAQLGSDVPFAVHGGTMRVGGRGERLEPFLWPRRDLWYVLVCPEAPVATAWAYAELDRRRAAGGDSSLSDATAYSTLVGSARGGRLAVDLDRLLAVLHNDFQDLVEGAKPIVAQASQLLADTEPLAASMSGSGSTVYGIYDDRTAARRAAEGLRAAGYPVFLCTPVPRAAAEGSTTTAGR